MKARSANPSSIRDINRTSVLNIIRRKGPISQTEILKVLSLQPSTILRITQELLDEQLIVPIGRGQQNAKGGRRATLLEINGEGAYAIGIDLNSDEIMAILLNLTGCVIGDVRMDCPSEHGADRVMETLRKAIQELLHQYGVAVDKVLGIGVAVPGKVDHASGVSVYAINFLNWSNVPIGKMLEEAFRMPVYLEVDMRAMAYGEMWFGRENDNMLCLGFRSGIGLGMIWNGQLYHGANQVAGDVGHVIVKPEGPLCNCGRKGCLEAVASERAIYNKVQDYMNRHPQYSVSGTASSVKELDMNAILEAFRHGDPVIREFVVEAAEYIGKVLCDLVRVQDPHIIVIGGHILASSPEFLRMVRETFNALQPNYADDVPEIEPARFGEKSIAIGAASLILSRVFQPSEKI